MHEFHNQDPKLQVIDEYAARKLIEEVNPKIDIEEAMKIEREFFKRNVSITDDTVEEMKKKISKAKSKGKG